MKITIESHVKASPQKVWSAWSTPADIKQWNSASDDWHTPHSTVDLREGGKFSSRMEARDGSMGFDFEGIYTRVVPNKALEYRMSDDREVQVEFLEQTDGVLVRETFDAETQNSVEMQRAGWQSILDNFVSYVEAKEQAS